MHSILYSDDPQRPGISWLLVDPVELCVLVVNHFTFAKPQPNLVLRGLNAVGAVADVAANILRSTMSSPQQNNEGDTYDSVIATNSAWCRLEGVGCTQKSCEFVSVLRCPIRYVRRKSILRPVLTASRPSQTIATIGPLNMSTDHQRLPSTLDPMASQRTSDEALEEGLIAQVFVMFFQMLLGGGDHFDGGELVATGYVSRLIPFCVIGDRLTHASRISK